jgi:hypothetical protein
LFIVGLSDGFVDGGKVGGEGGITKRTIATKTRATKTNATK